MSKDIQQLTSCFFFLVSQKPYQIPSRRGPLFLDQTLNFFVRGWYKFSHILMNTVHSVTQCVSTCMALPTGGPWSSLSLQWAATSARIIFKNRFLNISVHKVGSRETLIGTKVSLRLKKIKKQLRNTYSWPLGISVYSMIQTLFSQLVQSSTMIYSWMHFP